MDTRGFFVYTVIQNAMCGTLIVWLQPSTLKSTPTISSPVFCTSPHILATQPTKAKPTPCSSRISTRATETLPLLPSQCQTSLANRCLASCAELHTLYNKILRSRALESFPPVVDEGQIQRHERAFNRSMCLKSGMVWGGLGLVV